MSLEEDRLESAVWVRSIMVVINRFFIDPTPRKRREALERAEELPEALERYGKLCLAAQPKRRPRRKASSDGPKLSGAVPAPHTMTLSHRNA